MEAYVPRGRATEIRDAEARAREAARAAERVRFVRTTFLPDDEVCFFVFEAESARTVGAVTKRAGIRAERIIEVVEGVGSTERKEMR